MGSWTSPCHAIWWMEMLTCSSQGSLPVGVLFVHWFAGCLLHSRFPCVSCCFFLGVGDRTWWLQSAGRVKGEASKPSNWKSGAFEWAGLGDCLGEAVAIPRCRSEERILHEWRVVCSVRLRSGGPFSCSVSAHGPAQLPSKPGLTCVHHRG